MLNAKAYKKIYAFYVRTKDWNTSALDILCTHSQPQIVEI